MKPPIVVFLCGLGAALIAFGISASRKIQADPVNPAHAEQAVRRSLWLWSSCRLFSGKA